MTAPEILDVTSYMRIYTLERGILGLRKIEPDLDINEPGLMMHGSEADPATILKYGLVPQQARGNTLDDEWQVCFGLNADDTQLTISKDLSRKNSAVKYADYFRGGGIVYIIKDDVKLLTGYSEFWDEGEDGRGYAWVKKPVPPGLIIALITKNLSLAAAAIAATESNKPLYKPDGACYIIEQL